MQLGRWAFGPRALLVLPALAAIWFACSVNPATGKRELNLVSESQEIAIGQESDPELLRQFGSYDDPEIQQFVSELGGKLAALSERPDLPWTFRVVDDPLVNAFALPGGYVYITRGILAHFNSEAELVGVLGHEIGHVTARHGASQMSKQILAQAGLGVGMVLAPELAQDIGGLAQTGLSLLFLKYGRDDERQADSLGLRYSLRAGYDARAMADTFETLSRVSAASGAGGIPSWLSTHPDSANRAIRVREAFAASGVSPDGLETGRDRYLRLLDGVTYGNNPREGFFRDGTFYHPQLEFRFDYDPGWRTVNTREQVVILSPEQDAILRLQLAAQNSPQAAAQSFFEPNNIVRGQAWRQEIHGLDADSYTFEAQDESGNPLYRGLVAFIAYGGQTYQLLAYTGTANFDRYWPTFTNWAGSFSRLTDRAMLDVQPMRLQVVRLDRSTTVRDLGGPVPAETLALLNGVEADTVLEAGTLIKTVEGEDPSH